MEEPLLENNLYFAIIFSSIKRVSLRKSFYLNYVLEQGDNIFKTACENKKRYEYLAVDELPLNFPLKGTNFSVGDLNMKVFCLQKRINCLKITGIIVRAIEGIGQFLHVVDTVLQQHVLKMIRFYLIDTVVVQIA